MEEGGQSRMASSCIYVIACWCICICIFVLSAVDGANMGYMLSCREEGGYSSEAIAVFVCVFALFESACVVVRKKTGKRGRCGVGGGGGGHSGSGN